MGSLTSPPYRAAPSACAWRQLLRLRRVPSTSDQCPQLMTSADCVQLLQLPPPRAGPTHLEAVIGSSQRLIMLGQLPRPVGPHCQPTKCRALAPGVCVCVCAVGPDSTGHLGAQLRVAVACTDCNVLLRPLQLFPSAGGAETEEEEAETNAGRGALVCTRWCRARGLRDPLQPVLGGIRPGPSA